MPDIERMRSQVARQRKESCSYNARAFPPLRRKCCFREC